MQENESITETLAVKPWDLLGIINTEGKAGLQKRYRKVAPFAMLVSELADPKLRVPSYWYEQPRAVVALIALQAQWEEACSPDRLAWVASRFWTQDINVMQNYAKGYKPSPSFKNLNSYLLSAEFNSVYERLAVLARLQEKVNSMDLDTNNGIHTPQTSGR